MSGLSLESLEFVELLPDVGEVLQQVFGELQLCADERGQCFAGVITAVFEDPHLSVVSDGFLDLVLSLAREGRELLEREATSFCYVEPDEDPAAVCIAQHIRSVVQSIRVEVTSHHFLLSPGRACV